MASGSGSIPGRDPVWNYCSPVEVNRNEISYNFYGLLMKSGGITRFKFHLTHNDPHNNTKKVSENASQSERRDTIDDA